jgi:hypothetical protein
MPDKLLFQFCYPEGGRKCSVKIKVFQFES